jgi:opacity protein-like surface antigen
LRRIVGSISLLAEARFSGSRHWIVSGVSRRASTKASRDGVLPVPKIEGSTTLFTGAVLLGWAGSRVMPYGGAGGGMLRATAKTSVAEDIDTAPSWTGIAGLTVRLSRRVSAYGEYRYTVVEPTIVLGTQTVVFEVKPSQVVTGLSIAF